MRQESRKAQDVRKLQARIGLVSDNDPRLPPLDGKEASAEWTIQRSQSILPLSIGRSATYRNHSAACYLRHKWRGRRCKKRRVVGGAHGLLETPNSRGNAESTLACHRKSFSCSWCARWTMARKHSRTNRPVSFLSSPLLSSLSLPLSRFVPQLVHCLANIPRARALLFMKLREARRE